MARMSDREQFYWIVARELPAAELGSVNELLRLAKRHGRLCEKDCNEGIDPKSYESAEKRIAQIIREMGAEPVLSRDPRGATVKLTVPSGRTNDFGGEGICVPQ